MNFFRIAGDMCHLLSFVVMFWKLHSSQTVAGISLKTQELYVIVFISRYLDLFWNFLSIYNWVMKVIFITASLSIVRLAGGVRFVGGTGRLRGGARSSRDFSSPYPDNQGLVTKKQRV